MSQAPDDRPPAKAAPRVLRTLVRDACVIAAVTVVAEVAVRTAAPEYGTHLFDAEFTGGHPVAVNADGFRGPQAPRERAPDEFRILGIGDSTTYGTGVAAEDTWPFQAARIPRADGRRVTAVNAGAPATGLRQMAYDLDHSWKDLRPDVVALAVSGNQVSLAWIGRNDVPGPRAAAPSPEPSAMMRVHVEANRFVRQFCLPSFVSLNVERALYAVGLLDHSVKPASPYGAMLAHGWRQVGLDPALAEDAWRVFERDLTELRDAVARSGARFCVTALPARFTLTDEGWDNVKNVPRERLTIDPPERVRALCARLGIEYADSVAPLRERRRTAGPGEAPLYIHFDYTHLDAEGHAIVARAFSASPAFR